MSPSIKLLRVIVDKHLSWMDNINLEENKFSKNPALLYKTKSFLDGKEVTSIYYSFLHAVLIMEISHGAVRLCQNQNDLPVNRGKQRTPTLFNSPRQLQN